MQFPVLVAAIIFAIMSTWWRGRRMLAAVKDLIGEIDEWRHAGKRVAILEDVTTKGDSAMKAVKATQAEGATVALVLSIVDREDGAAALFSAEGVPFGSLFKASEFLPAKT